ncbi:hypothetical protein NHX12_011179 [Muraenolepis orangiensis]|uniref:BHLH domain-containing protein n=1 Tax=Muraenolepis orangiensis TaxID=630683 RepID=A0A9Q0DJ57_9TELE|nr:hypothetical protein NHX12_011179 [Muraenolepis orangiensis]
MKTFSPDFHSNQDYRRVPKSEMEKRRRGRINDSLETLRLLMLENTCNEKLTNPKVEKAEILETVVDFIRIELESYSAKRKLSADFLDDTSPACKRQQPQYSEGMRSCLLRVGEFISTKSQQQHHQQQLDSDSSSSPEGSPRNHQAASTTTATSVGDLTLSALLTARQPASPEGLHHKEDQDLQGTSKRFSSSSATVDPVWRPWPQ